MSTHLTRRDLLKLAGVGAATMLLPRWTRAADAPAQPPNLLFIITDQQSVTATSAAGCRWVKTPNMDRLAARA